MKELTDRYAISPKDICNKIPVLKNREHAKSNHSLDEIFKDVAYDTKLKNELEKGYDYVVGLVEKLSDRYETIGKLRIDLSKKTKLFDGDPDGEYDQKIIERLYFNSPGF